MPLLITQDGGGRGGGGEQVKKREGREGHHHHHHDHHRHHHNRHYHHHQVGGGRGGGGQVKKGEGRVFLFFFITQVVGGRGEEGSNWRRGRGEWRRRAWRISRLDWEMYERARAPNFVMHCGTPCLLCCTIVAIDSLGIVNTLQIAELTVNTVQEKAWLSVCNVRKGCSTSNNTEQIFYFLLCTTWTE